MLVCEYIMLNLLIESNWKIKAEKRGVIESKVSEESTPEFVLN